MPRTAACWCCGAAAPKSPAHHPTGPGCSWCAATSRCTTTAVAPTTLGAAALHLPRSTRNWRRGAGGRRAGAGRRPGKARFRLFDSIASFWQRAAARQPLLLVLDDLHRADVPSLRLLEFLMAEAQSSRLMVLGTYRDAEVPRQHPLSDTLAQLTGTPGRSACCSAA